MLVEVLQSSAPQVFSSIEQVIPAISFLVAPFLAITLQQVGRTQAKILANNLPKDELRRLRKDAKDAIEGEKIAIECGNLTIEASTLASLGKLVLTKIISASKERNKERPKKRRKRAYR
jgi:hypothetical protein